MNIVLGEEAIAGLDDRHIVLELDTFRIDGRLVKSFCLVESVPLDEMSKLDIWKDLHHKLIENYARRNWSFCQQAIEHLQGKWNQEVDSFYANLADRVARYSSQAVADDWSPVINR